MTRWARNYLENPANDKELFYEEFISKLREAANMSMPQIKQFKIDHKDAVKESKNSMPELTESKNSSGGSHLTRCTDFSERGKETAPGADAITYSMLRHMGDPAKQVYLLLVNRTYTEHIRPKKWQQQDTQPIPKPKEPGAYRLISLISSTEKVAERMVLNRLLWKAGPLHHRLYACREGVGTHECLTDVLSAINGKKSKVVFLDLEKAYELANAATILSSLVQKRIKGNLLTWTKGYMQDREARLVFQERKEELWQKHSTGVRLWVFLPLLGSFLGTGAPGAQAFTPKSVDGKLVVPDTTRIDNSVLKASEADTFLSLWFIYLLDEPVHVSSEPWTLLIPKNAGLPKRGGFLEDKDTTKKILLNHVVLGQVIDANNPPQRPAPSTMAGTPLIFTKDANGPMVNGVRLTGEEHKLSEGVVYILESSLPILDLGGGSSSSSSSSAPTRAPSTYPSHLLLPHQHPPLTHRFATFKPRRDRPLGLTSNNLKPEAQIGVIPENIEPVFEDLDPRPDEIGAFEEDLGSGSASDFSIPTRRRPSSASSGPSDPSSSSNANGNSHSNSNENKPSGGFSEFSGSEIEPSKEKTFLASFLDSLRTTRAHTGAEFLHHFLASNITDKFRDAGRYTALVPYDSAFYQYYPIDWGFNPFLVANFTRDVVLNHFIRGNVALEDLPSLAELTTLGGRVIKFIRKGNKLLGNGVEVVFESETVLSRGRSYVVQDLFFVDHERIMELQAEHGDLETAPLLGDPWPTSQFLSHLFDRVQQNERTSFFSEYLNLTNLAYLLPGHDENLDPLKYTAFIPLDDAIANILYADAPDPFILDETLREKFILNHLVKGRMYETDLKDGTTFTNLANNTMTITKGADGVLKVNNIEVIESQMYIYNLGVMYLIHGVVGVTDQDIILAVNKYPALNAEPTKELLPLPSLVPDNEPATTPEASTTLAPLSTTKSTTTTATTTTTIPTTVPERTTPQPFFRRSPPSVRPFPFTRSSNPRTTSTTTTTTTPSPSATTPEIRYETRTEISISRRVNDGELEPLAANTTS
ncbi:LOW QUALITY PROTEIN: uncharacterized protein LOC135226650 [Macrobrachium nipponense]|uniref:LOW QUALITY PROTEIN: uncharacterized protein LOC135226650 n=1 Tax=Macrobrachium nipponense TaxID=159736 RepID=UPI0030C89E9E